MAICGEQQKMKQYQDLIQTILKKGRGKKGRGIHGMKSYFGYQMRFDLRNNQMPIITTKKSPVKTMIHELLWFLSGNCENIDYLKKHKVKIWDGFMEGHNTLGPIYGTQWRRWPDYKGGHIDQIKKVIKEIKENPDSKTLLVSAWNVGQLDEMRLPPCHTFFQFDVRKGKLRCQLYQRSADVFLGVPFNIFEYALLTRIIAHVTGTEAREFIHVIGDAHLYYNQVDAAKEILKRKPYPSPRMYLNPKVKDIDDFKITDFKLIGYKAHKKLRVPIVIV